MRCGLASDFCPTRQLSAFFHGEHLGFNVAGNFRFIFELAAVRGDFTFDFTENFNLAGSDIAFDLGILTDGDFSFI